MKKIFSLLTLLNVALLVSGQQVLTLQECRDMALRQNKQLSVSRVQKDIAMNTRKSARTKYLPRVNAVAGYQWSSREVSILSDEEKNLFANLGTSLTQSASAKLPDVLSLLQLSGVLNASQVAMFQQVANASMPQLKQALNQVGQKINDAFRTDTRNMWAGSVIISQPLFMGGAITAGNKMADIAEQMAGEKIQLQTNETLYSIDETYWMVVSLCHKQKLAQSYNRLICKLDSDVTKMIKEGVATRADGLKVAVKKNESKMTLDQVHDGLVLAKMLLCQKCGMPLDSQITLADEDADNLAMTNDSETDISVSEGINNRAEIQLLGSAVELSEQSTKLARAAYYPQVLLTGGYLISNPSCFNSFEKKFKGMFNVGVTARIPVWNWFDTAYKIRAAKASTTIAKYQLSEAKEMIELQINQSRFKINEAKNRLATSAKNISSAEENLRCADVGFHEGVISSTDVIGAQTAWYQAQSQKIDAEIDLRMSQLALKKAIARM